MKTKIAVLLLSTLFAVSPLTAQEACPCVPTTHQWIVTPCETWNCAAAATITANGDKYVMSLPTSSEDFTWVVVRRIVSGAAAIAPDAPYRLESFDNASDATARYSSIDARYQPMLLTVPDGQFLVVARTSAETRRRSTTR